MTTLERAATISPPAPSRPSAGVLESVARLSRAAALAGLRERWTGLAPVEVAFAEPLRTPRLVLRPLAAGDRDEFLRVLAASREHLASYCPLHRDGESDEDLFERQLGLSRASLVSGRAWRRCAFDERGRLVGAFNLNDISRGLENSAEANWWVAADAVRLGLGTEGLGAAIRHALEDAPRGLGLHRVRALISPGNSASVRMAVRLGFVRRAAEVLGGSRVGPEMLKLGGRVEVHETYEIFPEVVLPVKGLPGIEPRWRAALAAVLSTEATSQMNG